MNAEESRNKCFMAVFHEMYTAYAGTAKYFFAAEYVTKT